MSDCIVLLSGGADSTICALIAKQEYNKVHALTINYGQRHVIELQSANAIAKALNLDSHEILALDQNVLKSTSPCLSIAFVEEYDSADELPNEVASTLVPARNQLFLTIAANRALYLNLNTIFTGVCETDYSGYPDCRRKFIEQLEETTSLGIFGNNSQISIQTPLMYLTKAESIIKAKKILGDRFDDIIGLTHTCYQGVKGGCAKCAACLLRDKGFKEANLIDPIWKYRQNAHSSN